MLETNSNVGLHRVSFFTVIKNDSLKKSKISSSLKIGCLNPSAIIFCNLA